MTIYTIGIICHPLYD